MSRQHIKTEWSHDFAYAIGLLATDGCIYRDGRHIEFNSKDLEQVENLLHCLKVEAQISMKMSGTGVCTHRVQFSNRAFCTFLADIGICPAKSLTLGAIGVPREYFFDFVRGCFDGDGSIYSYWDTRWKSSFMFYISFASASPHFIHWLKHEIFTLSGAKAHITRAYEKNICYQLKFSKHEAAKLVQNMYYGEVVSLSRKKLKISRIFAMMGFPDTTSLIPG